MGGGNIWVWGIFFQCALFHCAGSSVFMAECEPGPEIQLKRKYYPGLLLSRTSSLNGYNMHVHNNCASTEVGEKQKGTSRKRCPFWFFFLCFVVFLKNLFYF